MNTDELIKLFEKQCNYILRELSSNQFDNAVKDTELLSTWLKIKANEINASKE